MQLNPETKREQISSGIDSVVIRKYISGIPGGRSLDCSGCPTGTTYIAAGHVIIKKANGDYAPAPLNDEGTAYATLPEGATIAGLLYRTVSTALPMAAIVYDGIANDTLLPFALGELAETFKAQCPHIIFEHDEIA